VEKRLLTLQKIIQQHTAEILNLEVKENLSVKNTEKLVKVVNVANKLPLDASVSISRWSKFLSPKKFTKSQQRLIQQEHH